LENRKIYKVGIREFRMPRLKFYDVKGKTSFTTDKFTLTSRRTTKGMTYFAVAKAPSGIKAWRIVSKDFYRSNK